jgi:hypothetical protein
MSLSLYLAEDSPVKPLTWRRDATSSDKDMKLKESNSTNAKTESAFMDATLTHRGTVDITKPEYCDKNTGDSWSNY